MKGNRDLALDFTRGMLLLTMFLLHCVDEFAPLSFFAKSMRFVSGSFIFVVGFIISNIYIKKYNIYESKIYRRLFSRGLNLLLIFTVLNIAMTFVLSHSYDGRELNISTLINNIVPIYVVGIKEIISFDILLPIAYVLLAMSLLLFVSRGRFRLVAIITAIVLFVYCSIVYFNKSIYYNFGALTIGFFGVAFGFMRIESIRNKLMKYIYVVIILYLMQV